MILSSELMRDSFGDLMEIAVTEEGVVVAFATEDHSYIAMRFDNPAILNKFIDTLIRKRDEKFYERSF